MKKYYFLAIAVLGVMTACSKQNATPEIDDTTVEAVSFGVNSPLISAAQTRALGGVDAWADNNLYIYSFPRTVTDFSVPAAGTEDEIFIDNVMVKAADSVTPMNSAYTTEEPFYYASDNTCYDFYGYYVDDAAGAVPTPIRAADRVYLPITITGGQDIMLAKAQQIEDVKNTAVDPLRAYSAYSARRLVKPTLKFNHQLARFNFYVVAGSDATVETGKEVKVTSITIKDTKVSADLNIVGANRGLVDNASSATLATLSLMQKDAATDSLVALEPVGPATYYMDVADRQKKENWTKIGESIMVIPGESKYTMGYALEQAGVQAPNETSDIILDIKKFDAEAEAFMAGYQYNVIITIYGLEKVEINTILSPWEDGGDFGYDPDEDWGKTPTAAAPGSAYVYNDGTGASWGLLPEDYRAKYTWSPETVASLPYLAVWFNTVEDGTSMRISATRSYKDAEGNDQTETAPMTGFPQPITYHPTLLETVITLNPAELGVAEILPGDWTVTVTNEATGVELYSATITVPAN